MLEPGHMNLLTVHAIDDQGAWLQANKERALLAKSEVTGEMAPGDQLAAFVYADLEGKMVATLQRPLAELGEFALMRAKQVNSHGAFMDWGLAKVLPSGGVADEKTSQQQIAKSIITNGALHHLRFSRGE